MNPQTVFFLQAVWDVSEQKDKVLGIARSAMIHELESTMRGPLDERTIYVSEEAKEAYRKLGVLRGRIGRIGRPYDLLKLSGELEQLRDQILELHLCTLRTLASPSGPVMSEFHILSWQLFEPALEKLKKQYWYHQYRTIFLGEKINDQRVKDPPQSDRIQDWISFFVDVVQPWVDGIPDQLLDGRWAYERKSVLLLGKIRVDQFIEVWPRKEELAQPPGIPGTGTGDGGEFRIFGRGLITNIRPEDQEDGSFMIEEMKGDISSYEKITSINADPGEVLSTLFGEKKYVVEPVIYADMANKYLIATTFHQRIKAGRCLYCGSPLYLNKCSECGHVWKI